MPDAFFPRINEVKDLVVLVVFSEIGIAVAKDPGRGVLRRESQAPFYKCLQRDRKRDHVRLYLPRHEGDTVEGKEVKPGNIPLGNGETILLVEDESGILIMEKMMLERLGYRVLTQNEKSPISA